MGTGFVFFKSLCDSQFKETLLGTCYIISVSHLWKHSDTAFKIKAVNLFLCPVNSSFTGTERFFTSVMLWRKRGGENGKGEGMVVEGILPTHWCGFSSMSTSWVRKAYIGAMPQTASLKQQWRSFHTHVRIKLKQKLVLEAGLFLQSTLPANIYGIIKNRQSWVLWSSFSKSLSHVLYFYASLDKKSITLTLNMCFSALLGESQATQYLSDLRPEYLHVWASPVLWIIKLLNEPQVLMSNKYMLCSWVSS